MKKVIGILVMTLASLGGYAQSQDTLSTRYLQEVIITTVSSEADTLQNFYRANRAATTEHILSRMSGISLIRRGPFGQEPVIRSMSGGQMNVTIDGMKIFGACTDKMDPVTIYVEPQNLSAVQALMGTEGLAYGSTFGGAINLKLAEPQVGAGNVNAQAGVDHQSAARAFNYFSHVAVGTEQAAYRISSTYRKSRDYRVRGATIPFSQYEKLNLAFAGKWTLGRYDTLQTDLLYDGGWNIGFPALAMDVSRATARIFALSWHRVAPVLIFRNIDAKVYHNRISHMMTDRSRKTEGMVMDMPGLSRTSGGFVEADVHIFHEHQTVAKVEYYANRLLGEMIMYPGEGTPMYMQTAPEATRRTAGFFVSQRVRLSSKDKLLLSFRADVASDRLMPGTGKEQWDVFRQHAPAESTVAHTTSLLYKRRLGSKTRLELQGGYGQRIPTLNERYGYYLFNQADGYDYLGNPALGKENSWNMEATLQYFGNAAELQLTPFYQRVSDYIMGHVMADYRPMTQGARGVKQHVSVTAATLAGADAIALFRISSAVHGIASMKYTRGTAGSEPLPHISPLKTVTSLRYEKGAVNAQAELEWSAAQRRVNRPSGEQMTPSYAVLSLRTGWEINSFLQCNTGVENIFDKVYREHLDWGPVPRPGRNVYLNLIYTFDKER